jgi:hypothetical protein
MQRLAGFVRLVVGALVGTSVGIACTSTYTAVNCDTSVQGCACTAFTSSGSPPPSACDPTAFPGTTCCADPGWPSLTTGCACRTGTIFCGIVPAYFTNGADGCVCGPFQYTPGEMPGATCFPGASTTQSSVGICCMYPSGECACAAGPHTCETGAAAVTTCSAANFPPPGTCTSGRVNVASCSAGAAPIDSGTPESDVSSFGSCTSNADCDPMFQFCLKGTCDPTATGTCATRPGSQQTFYCSPTDGGGPVCGCDGQTWPYACIANGEGINVAAPGPCASSDAGGD